MVCRRFDVVITGNVSDVSLRLLHSAKIDATANEVVVKIQPAIKDLGRVITEAKRRRFPATGDALSLLLRICRSAALRKLAFKGVPTLTADVLTAISENVSFTYVRFLDLDKEIADDVTGLLLLKAVRSFGGFYSLRLRPLARPKRIVTPSTCFRLRIFAYLAFHSSAELTILALKTTTFSAFASTGPYAADARASSWRRRGLLLCSSNAWYM